MIGFLLAALGPFGVALVVAVPTLVAIAAAISHRENIRAQLSSDVRRNGHYPGRR